MEAQKYKKPVHGFAMTKFQTTLKLVPYDSVDSSSWVMGQKYGLTYIFMGNRWKVLTGDDKKYRRRYRQYFKSIGVNWELIEADNVDELRKSNVIAWRNLSARYHEMKVRRDHQLGMKEVGPIDDATGEEIELEEEEPSPVSITRSPFVSAPQPTYEPVVTTPSGGSVRVRIQSSRPLAGFGVPINDPTRRRAQ